MMIDLRKLFTLFILAISFLTASSFESLTGLASLSSPDTSGLDMDLIYYNVGHQELLRESRNDTLLSRYTLRDQNIAFTHVGKELAFKADWSRKVFSIADLFNSDYTATRIRPVSNAIKLSIATKTDKLKLFSSVQYTHAGSSDTLFITDFPSSDQNALNSYFFELLPQTFGDTIPLEYSSDHFSSALALTNDRLFIHLKYSHHIDRLHESHINSSDNDLNGPRESLCKIRYSGIQAFGSWKADKISQISFGFNYHALPLNWEHTVFPNDPDTLEIIGIANAKTYAVNIQAGYRLMSYPFNFNTTLQSGYMNNTSEASTPVLGYVLRFLPISHQANANISSTYVMAHAHFDYPVYAGRSIFTPRLDLIAGRFWSDLSVNALLQFGLEDIDIQEKYIHAAYIASIGAKAQIALNRDLDLYIEADQLLPYIKTVLPVTPQPEPSDIKRYGGLSIDIGISMTW